MLDRPELERWLFGTGPARRRVQDSPILPDVWFAYALELAGEAGPATPLVANSVEDDLQQITPPASASKTRGSVVDVLLRPTATSNSSDLAQVLGRRLGRKRTKAQLAYNDAYVACRLDFGGLIQDALPLTEFWQACLWPGREGPLIDLLKPRTDELAKLLAAGAPRMQGRRFASSNAIPGDVVWLIGLIGRIAWERTVSPKRSRPTAGEVVKAAFRILGQVAIGPQPEAPVLWTVSRNRPVQTSVWRSRVACKADAATRLFGLSCRNVRWAVIDSGIDARHPAFARRDDDAPVQTSGESDLQTAKSRIIGTWDFSNIREELVAPPPLRAQKTDDDRARRPRGRARPAHRPAGRARALRQLGADRARRCRSATTKDYRAPRRRPRHARRRHPRRRLAHAGRPVDPAQHDLAGDVPRHGDLRPAGLQRPRPRATSSQILSACSSCAISTRHADVPVSTASTCRLSVPHDVDKYACGRHAGLRGVPIALSAAASWWSPPPATTAASGYAGRRDGASTASAPSRSPTPGNAEKVITVGATHRYEPHTYGVCYFSSRGPTGDGRAKPDLVAPGEKITSAVPGAGWPARTAPAWRRPTSAAPAAMLLARHPELIGQPERLKQILCRRVHRPRPRAVLPGRRDARRPPSAPGGLERWSSHLEALAALHGDCLLLHFGTTDDPRTRAHRRRPGRGLRRGRSSHGSRSCAQQLVQAAPGRRRSAAARAAHGQPHRRRPHRRVLVQLAATTTTRPAVPWLDAQALWLNTFDDVTGQAGQGGVASFTARRAGGSKAAAGGRERRPGPRRCAALRREAGWPHQHGPFNGARRGAGHRRRPDRRSSADTVAAGRLTASEPTSRGSARSGTSRSEAAAGR